MAERLISADGHIDMTYCPPELWSDAAPPDWKSLVPHTVERDDGLHWVIDGADVGMWNGLGPIFTKFAAGVSSHLDEMKDLGFTWDHRRGALARPTDPGCRLEDLDRDGVHAEVIYGCLRLNDIIKDPAIREFCCAAYNDWAASFAKRSDPKRVFPLALIPNSSPAAGAAEVERCAKLGLRGGEMAFKGMTLPLWHRDWDAVWRASAECRFPISFHSTGFKALKAPLDREMEKQYLAQWQTVITALFQLDTMEVLVSLLASGACERFPDFNFVLGESGVTWLPYVFDRLDMAYEDRGRSIGLKMKPSDYFRRQGYVTYQQDKYLEPILPLIGDDRIMWGSDFPHPDSLWPHSHEVLDRNLANLPQTARRKIVHDNAAALYDIA